MRNVPMSFSEYFSWSLRFWGQFVFTYLISFAMFRVATGNPVVFTLSPPECYMEIRNGYGTSGTRVGGKISSCLLLTNKNILNLCEFWFIGPVRVGDPLTLIIYMRSKYGKIWKIKQQFKLSHFLILSSDGFDIVVNDW